MAWTILTTQPTWNVTDLELVKRVQYMLLENGNADANGTANLTNMFSIAEIISYINQRQEAFLKDTGCIVLRATQGSTPSVQRYALPPDWIMTRRMTWVAQAAGSKIRALARTDAYALDAGMLDWEQNTGDPSVYNDGSDLPTLTVEIAKGPGQAGTMGLHYVAQPVACDGSGIKLSICDEFESGILYGVLADLLGSDGEGLDAERAAYCESRYQLCVDLAKILMEGLP